MTIHTFEEKNMSAIDPSFNRNMVVTYHGQSPGNPPEKKPIDQWGSEEVKGDEENVTWDTFTQNTTFHGVKYVFNRSQYRFRR